jgi:hypothetical protein
MILLLVLLVITDHRTWMMLTEVILLMRPLAAARSCFAMIADHTLMGTWIGGGEREGWYGQVTIKAPALAQGKKIWIRRLGSVPFLSAALVTNHHSFLGKCKGDSRS